MSNSRFEDVPEWVNEMLVKIRNENFTSLASARIKVLYDIKKRMSGGKLVLGRIQSTNDLIRHLTSEEAGFEDGYHYIMYLDKACFENIEDVDKTRIMRHELRHCFISENGKYQIVPHEIEDFYEEIEYNQDDPRWKERCVAVAENLYEEESN